MIEKSVCALLNDKTGYVRIGKNKTFNNYVSTYRLKDIICFWLVEWLVGLMIGGLVVGWLVG